jgi:putative colanic acid biosynthesis acetyltransferase WcaF
MPRSDLTKINKPDFPDRIWRAAWTVVWYLLFKITPIPMHRWRCFLLRLFGADISSTARPYPSARIWAPWNLTMEDGSCLGSESDCYNVAHVILSRNCIVSQKAYLCTASHDIRDPGFPLTGAPIIIGEGAWVASAAFVGPGVTIGDSAVVAACAVVSRSVEPSAIVAGNPADRIGTRTDVALPVASTQ